ncbi:MAG: helix-turn-helix transcriptional regulator [Bdellovibrionales bacterium]|nr:helix-turn-helix transcriptional regulator [Bdellovibrionales bacterium]
MLSKILKSLMDGKGVSATALCKACNIPKSTLSTYLSGKKESYSPDHLGSLSSYFSVTTDYLLFGEESDSALLNTLPTEGVFEGWLRVKIERAIPVKKGNKN